VSSPLALSPDCRPELSHFGEERQPILTVAGTLADPEAVIAIAARHRFGVHGPYYPGLRAPVSEAIAMPLVTPLLAALERAFDLFRPPRYRECFLSVVTQAPEQLAPIQRLPHFDGVERERLAVLLYLDRGERGGTGFYRQRGTGFESVDAERLDTYRAALESDVARHGLPGAAYIAGDTAIFARTHLVEGAFNTMAIYRGNTLHCAALATDFVPDPDPAKGRLTLNLFLD